MTTPAAERLYQAQHLSDMEGRRVAVFNPHGKPLDELPAIYAFNNGGSPGWYSAVAISADGHCLGGHCCSHECYMQNDLGVLEGTRTDRHAESYQKHYPNGYRMEWVPTDQLKAHVGFREACRLNALLPKPTNAEAA
jgi:hypothetical protein